MMHAKIIETPDRPQPDAALNCSLDELTAADRAYYRCRANQEADAARRASCCEARLAHEEMAKTYRLLCGSRRCEDDPRLATELSAFLFKRKSTD